MLAKLTLEDFLKKTASNEPVPGGGSIAALGGATAAALGEMVAGLTIGRKKYEAVEGAMLEVQEKAIVVREKLLQDIDRDADSYNSVMEAMKLPKETEEEKQARKEAIETATKQAALIPLEVAKTTLEFMPLIQQVVEKGNQNAVSDGAVAAMMARTAVKAALYNVKINLLGLKDEAFIADLTPQIEAIEAQAEALEKSILNQVNL